MEIKIKEIQKLERPEKLDRESVIYWSEHYKKLEGCEDGKAIQTKARKFLKLKLVDYDIETKEYLVKPIKGYNKTTYHLKHISSLPKYNGKGLGEFECSCQFNQTVHKMCSHILALYLQLKIWNWNKKKELNTSINLI